MYREEKIMRGSQLVFVYASLVGALLMNASIFFFIGPATDAMCMARPWFFNMASTLMCVPLLIGFFALDFVYFFAVLMLQSFID